MATNPFFEPYEQKPEQDLWNELIVESIQVYSQDMKYIPRHLVNYDQLFGADDSSRFDSSYTIEMLIKSTLGFGGDKDFYSQFGHQIRDEVVFSVARARFMAEVGIYENMPTPNEGPNTSVISVTSVYYMKPEWFRDGIFGVRPRASTVKELEETHTFLKQVRASDLEVIFRMMQGENWSPNGEARPLIEEKGLRHTSMSVGDLVVEDDTDKMWIVAMFGFEELN